MNKSRTAGKTLLRGSGSTFHAISFSNVHILGVTFQNHRRTFLDFHHCSGSFCHRSAWPHEYIRDTNLLLSSNPLSPCERSSLPLEFRYLRGMTRGQILAKLWHQHAQRGAPPVSVSVAASIAIGLRRPQLMRENYKH